MYAHAEDLYQNSIMLCTTQRPQAELRSQQNTGYNDIRLPRIVIPSFSGGYTTYLLQWYMITNNYHIIPIQYTYVNS